MLQRARDASGDGHLDVLGSIPAAYRNAVLEQCDRRTLAKGELIWSQGEPAEYVAFLVRRFPELALAIIRALSVRLRWVAQLAVTLETQSASERICAVLLALSERFGVESEAGVLTDLKLTNDDLAAIAGVSRQFANATLQDLRKRGLIAARKRSLVITQPGGLEELAYQA